MTTRSLALCILTGTPSAEAAPVRPEQALEEAPSPRATGFHVAPAALALERAVGSFPERSR